MSVQIFNPGNDERMRYTVCATSATTHHFPAFFPLWYACGKQTCETDGQRVDEGECRGHENEIKLYVRAGSEAHLRTVSAERFFLLYTVMEMIVLMAQLSYMRGGLLSCSETQPL